MAQVSSIADEQTSTPLSSSKSITLRIAKYNPKHDESSGFMEFSVPYEKWTTVLEAILEVKKHFDHSVAVRYSCRQATCGSCGMMINGKPRLACFTKISELNSNVITVEPMNNFPIIRDLAVNVLAQALIQEYFTLRNKALFLAVSMDSCLSQSAATSALA